MTEQQFEAFMDEQRRQTRILDATMRLTAAVAEGVIRNGTQYGASNYSSRINSIVAKANS